MRISDWSSDVCSSDLPLAPVAVPDQRVETLHAVRAAGIGSDLRRQAEEARGAGDALPGLEMAMLAIGEAILFRRVLVALSRRDQRLALRRPLLVEHFRQFGNPRGVGRIGLGERTGEQR